MGSNKVYTVDYCDTSLPPAEWLSVVSTVNNDTLSSNYGKLLKTEYFKKTSSASTLLRKADYAYSVPPTGGQEWADGGLQRESVVVTNDAGQQSKVVYLYGEFGRLEAVSEYDWKVGASFPLVRKTEYDYLDTQGGVDYRDTGGQFGNFFHLATEVRVKDGAGVVRAKTAYAYDSTPLVTYTTTPPPFQTRNASYTSTMLTRGNTTGVTRWENIATGTTIVDSMTWDIFGNLVDVELNCCRQKHFVYGPSTQYAFPDSVTKGAGETLTTSYTWDANTSLLKTTTDPINHVTSYAYDAAWRLQTESASSIDNTTARTVTRTLVYDDVNRSVATQLSYHDDGIAKTVTSKSWFDGAGRTIRSATGAGASPASWDAVQVRYDSLGRPVWQSNPYTSTVSDASGSPSYWTKLTYDRLSRVTVVTRPDGQTLTNAYSGKTVTTADEAGRKRASTVDGLGRVVTVAEQDPAQNVSVAPSWNTTVVYDVLDDVLSVNQGGQVRSYTFDALGRMKTETTPEAGLVRFEYTDFDAVRLRTDARGVETHIDYDGLNRPERIDYTGSNGGALPAGVDPMGPVVIAWNTTGSGNGQIQSIADGTGVESFGYDSIGRMTSRTYTTGALAWTTGYALNSIGQQIRLTYPSGLQVKTAYDMRGRLSALTKNNTPAVTYLSGIVYNSAGFPTTLNLGNGVTETYTWSADRLQLTRQQAVKGVTTLMDLNYSYVSSQTGQHGTGTATGKNTGQLMSITSASTLNGQQANQGFAYDLLGRLEKATGPGPATTPAWQRRFVYDRWANRTEVWDKVTVGQGTRIQSVAFQRDTAGVPLTNRISTVTNATTVSYLHDAAGDVTSDGYHSYKYDAAQRITKVDNGATGDYAYDAANRRVRKTAGGQTVYSVWDGARVIAEYSDNGALLANYVFAGGRMLAKEAGTTRSSTCKTASRCERSRTPTAR